MLCLKNSNHPAVYPEKMRTTDNDLRSSLFLDDIVLNDIMCKAECDLLDKLCLTIVLKKDAIIYG